MRIQPLHADFGVEVGGLDLETATSAELSALRELFEEHSLLVFRDQALSETRHRNIAAFFGPLEDLRAAATGVPGERPLVSNRATSGQLVEDEEMRLLDIKANFYWHTDSTFLPTPAIANVLVGCVIPPSPGGATEFVSTRAGWERLPQELKARVRDAVFVHRFAHSRSLVDPRLGALPRYTGYPDTRWRAVWTNPVNGRESLLFGAHICAVDGMDPASGAGLIAAVTDHLTPPRAIYAHQWRTGDVLIWDERATLHRGTPWNFEEERTLASFVSSARDSDGIDSVRP